MFLLSSQFIKKIFPPIIIIESFGDGWIRFPVYPFLIYHGCYWSSDSDVLVDDGGNSGDNDEDTVFGPWV